MKDQKKPVCRRDNIVVQELDGEVLIYDLVKNKAFCLNQTSALVWQNCDGTKTVAEINDTVGKLLKAQVNEDIIWLALDQLGREDLIERESKPESKFTELSRRDVIKKVGLATVVALPVVVSLVAPLAVHANSACIAGGGCTCSTNGTVGAICPTSVACGDANCRCQRINNGGANNGTCVP